jgi:hypothetical protein
MTYERMVQEKVGSCRPSDPQTSTRGGTIMPKLNIQTKAIISQMFNPEKIRE